MDAAFEVTVAGQYRGDDQVVLGDRVRDVFGQRAAVADARRAAVADEVEAERVERAAQPRLVEVIGDDFRSRREARLHPGPRAQPALDRVAREQSGCDHHGRVRGVRARGDRGDDDRAVGEVGLRPGRHRRSAAAFALEPLERDSPSRGPTVRAAPRHSVERLAKRHRDVAERDAILWPPRSREIRFDRREIELERLAEDRVRGGVRAEQRLRLRVGLDERDLLRVAPGEPQVVERVIVDREDRDRRAVLR